MARGPKKHLKRLNAPSHWMLDKLGGIFAPRPRPGPHKLRESLPLLLIIRNRLQYALTGREALMILKQRLLRVDGKIRTDPKYPAGFMDVVTIPEAKEQFRLLYDTKGRYTLHRIKDDEVKVKLSRVINVFYGPDRTPSLSTHDGRTIRFPDPNIRINDTVVVDLETGKIKDWIRFKPGCLVMITGGANTGRVGEVLDTERHPGSFDIVHLKDMAENKFTTRLNNCFVIGAKPNQPLVSLPKNKGVKIPLLEDRQHKLTENSRTRQAGRKGRK